MYRIIINANPTNPIAIPKKICITRPRSSPRNREAMIKKKSMKSISLGSSMFIFLERIGMKISINSKRFMKRILHK